MANKTKKKEEPARFYEVKEMVEFNNKKHVARRTDSAVRAPEATYFFDQFKDHPLEEGGRVFIWGITEGREVTPQEIKKYK